MNHHTHAGRSMHRYLLGALVAFPLFVIQPCHAEWDKRPTSVVPGDSQAKARLVFGHPRATLKYDGKVVMMWRAGEIVFVNGKAQEGSLLFPPPAGGEEAAAALHGEAAKQVADTQAGDKAPPTPPPPVVLTRHGMMPVPLIPAR